jgi:phosphoribosyl 1,2-cyclic phosphodiesterase
MPGPVTKLSFWGVRGSTPTVDPATWRYGGNTPCLELTAPDGTQFILDCGTGLRVLGSRWTAPSAGSIPAGVRNPETHILVTHYHWDHIQGVPFFTPLYSENNAFHFYSFRSKHLGRDSLKQVFETQMATPYFPVNMSAMTARKKFMEIGGGDSFTVGENKVTARYINHPQGCLGFRIETPGGIVVYATDNEPGDPELDAQLRELAAGADIFINDAQYTPEQLATTRKGWGHSSWREGVKVAREVGAKTLVLFHHDPDSADRTVDGLLRQAREEFDSVFAASEGMVIKLGSTDGTLETHMPVTRTALRREAHFRATVSGITEGGHSFAEETIVQDLALQGARISMRHCPRLQSELQIAMETPGVDGPKIMRLRGYVVRIESNAEKESGGEKTSRGEKGSSDESGQNAVGVVFTE